MKFSLAQRHCAAKLWLTRRGHRRAYTFVTFNVVASLSLSEDAEIAAFTCNVPPPLAVSAFTPLIAPPSVPKALLVSVRSKLLPVTVGKLNVVPVSVVSAPSANDPVNVRLSKSVKFPPTVAWAVLFSVKLLPPKATPPVNSIVVESSVVFWLSVTASAVALVARRSPPPGCSPR